MGIMTLAENAYRTDYVLNLVDRGDLLNASIGIVDMERASRYFYRHFPDDFDFLVVRSARSLVNGVHGFSKNVRNDIEGIGLEQFDDSADWGSAGRLQSALFINYRMVGPIVHELAHTWANHLEQFDRDRNGSHWGRPM